MPVADFNMGDRVVITHVLLEDEIFYQPGNTGTIVWIDEDHDGFYDEDEETVTVQFDQPFHYLDGEWAVRPNQLRLEGSSRPMKEGEITALELAIKELTDA
jgi:hypothetical protein